MAAQGQLDGGGAEGRQGGDARTGATLQANQVRLPRALDSPPASHPPPQMASLDDIYKSGEMKMNDTLLLSGRVGPGASRREVPSV